MWERAGKIYRTLGPEGKPFISWIEHNRAIALRNLGLFEASIQASKTVQIELSELGQLIEAAHAQQNLAVTYFVQGQFNEALRLLDETRDTFYRDGRERDALLVNLFISDCLLQLRRFVEVLDKCQQVRGLFDRLGTHFEGAQAILNEATAYSGLRRFPEAETSLGEARRLFEAEGNSVWVAFTDLERAVVMQAQNRYTESLQLAQACARILREHDLPVEEAQAFLITAKAMIGAGRYEEAQTLVAQALSCGTNRKIPMLIYQSHHLAGAIAAAEGRIGEALTEYDQAIEEIEHLRGWVMVEYRAGFQEDKQALYEDALDLCLDLDLPERGLDYAERAKSRALLDLIACRLELEIQPRDAADRELIAQLQQLRRERDRLYRRQDTEGGFETRGDVSPSDAVNLTQQDVLSIEKKITGLWHRLLIRHADYARDADLWRVQTAPVRPLLAQDTVLIEYFITQQQVVAFLVSRDAVLVRKLPAAVADISTISHNFCGSTSRPARKVTPPISAL